MRIFLLKRLALMACLPAMLSACANAPAIPDGYAGPIAVIQDSATSDSPSRAQIFYVDEVDGRSITTSLVKTRANNRGQGFALTPTVISRDVPAKSLRLKLSGQVEYGAPIQAMLNAGTTYSIDRVIDVTLAPNHTYVVKGQLTAERKAVWLVDSATGETVGGQ